MPKLPGHHHRRFTVTASHPTAKNVTTDDGMPLREWQRVGDLMQRITYVGDLERLEGRWALILQWVDLGGGGHIFALPHEVVDRLLDRAESIKADCRSERAQNAARTRRENADTAAPSTGA